MNRNVAAVVLCLVFTFASVIRGESLVLAENDASNSAYTSGWSNTKNGGSGFGNWSLTTEGNDNERHSGFFISNTKSKPDLNGIDKGSKAFGLFANGTGFEQAVGYRGFDKPLQKGDSFSFMMNNGLFEKKFDKDDPTPGSIGLALRTSNANSSVADYNKDAVFEFGYYQGKNNFQIYDGSGPDKADSGVAFTDSGVSVTVTITGSDSYDLELQTMKDKNV